MDKLTFFRVLTIRMVTALGLVSPIWAQAQSAIPHLYQSYLSITDPIRCVTSICGRADQLKSVSQVLEERKAKDKSFDERWKHQFEILIKTQMELDKTSTVAGYARAMELLKAGHKIRDAQGAYAGAGGNLILKVASRNDREFSYYLKTLDSEDWHVQIDEEKTNELSGALNPQQLKAFKDILSNAHVLMYNDINYSYLQKIKPWQARLRRKFPQLGKREALKSETRYQRGVVELMVRELGKSYLGFFATELSLIESLERGEELSSDQMDLLFANGVIFDYFAYILNSENISRFAKLPNRTRQALTLSNTSKRWLKARAMNLDDQFEKVKNVCYPKLAAVSATRLTDGELRKANTMIADVIQASVRVLNRWGARWASDEVIGKVLAAQFTFDGQGWNYFSKFEQRLLDDIRQSRQVLEDVKTSSDESDQNILKAVLADYSEDANNSDETYVGNLCKKIAVESVSDAAYTDKGRIRTSWYTAVSREYGAGIVAHELGHILAARMAKFDGRMRAPKMGSETYACVANRNPFVVNPVAAGLFQQTTWSEEDFADFFAAQVILELRAHTRGYHNSKNLFCGMMTLEDGEYLSNHLSMFPPDNDGHSSILMRAIFQAYDLGELPRQCAPFLSFAEPHSRELICKPQ